MMRKTLRRLTNPTAKTIGSIWTVVILVSGFVIHQGVAEARCNQEFHAALLAHAQYAEQGDALDEEQDRTILQWVHDLSNPPNWVVLGDARARQLWLHAVASQAATRSNAIIAERAKIREGRKQHPYPELTCGV